MGHPRTARVLLLLVVPGHLVFMYTISYLKAGHTSLTPIFVVTYLLVAFLQVRLRERLVRVREVYVKVDVVFLSFGR